MLDFSHDGYEALFKNALNNGLNLFCGAGFSVCAKDGDGNGLPVGAMLLEELKEHFPTIKDYDSLPWACTKLVGSDKESFHAFLRRRFKVGDYDQRYAVLASLPIRNIYTTNIDDLLPKLYQSSDAAIELVDRSLVGAGYKEPSGSMVGYHPLHGSVTHPNEDFVFGAEEIASAFSSRGEIGFSWRALEHDAKEHPILFWGWNFADAGPIKAMFADQRAKHDNPNRWALLHDAKPQTIDVLESLGFNIILGGTNEMLEYLWRFVSEEFAPPRSGFENVDSLRKYWIPVNDDNLPSHHLEEFFVELSPSWSHVYSGDVPKTTCLRKASNAIATGKDVFVIGIRGSGKTTLLMQVAISYESRVPIHYMVAPSVAEARLYLKKVGSGSSLLLVDDCFRDTNAVIELLSARNVQTVFFSRDSSYEGQYHKLRRFSYELVDVSLIQRTDGQAIINSIPTGVRYRNANLNRFEKDPTIPAVLSTSMHSTNFKFLQKFYEEDADAARVFLMIVYVHYCGTPCSFDMVYSFLGDDRYTWNEMLEIVGRIGGLVSDCSDGVLARYDAYQGLQDYYECRSRVFAERLVETIPLPTRKREDLSWYGEDNKLLAKVLMDFCLRVMPYKICSYDAFKRRAYDSDFACRAFPKMEDGAAFYEVCLERDESEYVYQQAALYFAKLGNFRKAFEWVDRAYNLARFNRFSIDATRAQISFDANIQVDESQALRALDILRSCCTRDQRKETHFLAYATRCLRFCERYPDADLEGHLESALRFVEEGLSETNKSLGYSTRRALGKQRRRLLLALGKRS